MILHGFTRHVARLSAIVALLGTLLWAGAQPASAHESREVGPYTFVVGFLDEPAYTHIPNAVSLSISDTATEAPVEDLGDTLEVDVTFGDESFTSTLRPRFGEPGQYQADFVPSRPGQWTFRFYGTVGDLEVDETFVSGPDTFNDVNSLSEESFPVNDPSTGELAERLDQELARVNERVEENSSGSTDEVALVLSGVALLLGAGALVTALLVRRKS
jgi:hypothetical protein